MQEKVALITGITGNLGRELAVSLVKQGVTVLGISRTAERGKVSLREIRTESGSAQVGLFTADFASQQQIGEMVEAFRNHYYRLDMLIHAAATFEPQRQLTKDGIERTFAINYLGPYLLTALLLNMLKASAPSRIVILSSRQHERAKLDFDNLQGEKSYNLWDAAALSKLTLIMFTYSLAERLQGTGVTVNALHPGFMPGGGIRRNMPTHWRWIMSLLAAMPFAKTGADGAAHALRLATDPALADVSGAYFVEAGQGESLPISYDQAAQQRLWEESAKLAGLPLNWAEKA